MPECHYGKEPLDLKLLLLRVWKQGWIIGLVTLLGTFVFGGGYYLEKMVIPPKQYAAMSLYQVEYVLDPVAESEYTYINHDTWRRWMTTKEFLDILYKNLEGTQDAGIDRETMKTYLSAELLTDHRMPDTIVTTPDPDLTLRLAAAVEQSMVDFAGIQKGIEAISVVDPAVSTTIFNEARPLNACILSAVIFFVLSLAVIMLKELGSDSIWLPATISSGYGLKVLGTINSRMFEENVHYLFRDRKTIGVMAVESADLSLIISRLQKIKDADKEKKRRYVTLPNPLVHPAVCTTAREMDGLILVVKAGAGSGKRMEAVLEILKTQDIKVDAALLTGEDEKLIKRYYWQEALMGGKR